MDMGALETGGWVSRPRKPQRRPPMAEAISAAINDSVSRRVRVVSSRKRWYPRQSVMTAIRSRLSWVLASWLVFQFSGIAAPIVLVAGHAEQPCTCLVMDHATCPMHQRQAPSRDADGRCRIQNAAAPSDLLALSLGGGAALVSDRASFDTLDVRRGVVSPLTVDRASRVELPESPPPRA